MSDSNGPSGAVLPNQAVVTEPRKALDLIDEINKKLAQVRGYLPSNQRKPEREGHRRVNQRFAVVRG
jgi:hypothetical protein